LNFSETEKKGKKPAVSKCKDKFPLNPIPKSKSYLEVISYQVEALSSLHDLGKWKGSGFSTPLFRAKSLISSH